MEYDWRSGQVVITASQSMVEASSITTVHSRASPGLISKTSVEVRTSSDDARCLASAVMPPSAT
jgi:hypothetical protein